jgi:hypothetical protein
MATYMLLNVACDHCKETSWTMLPYGPGVIPLELARRWIDFPRLTEPLVNIATFAVSAITVAALTWILHMRNRWLGVMSGILALLFFSFCAFVLKALIQA